MMTFSYTLFPTLKKELENIDVTRNKVLCELISPSTELRIRFDRLAEKASSALFLAGKSINEREIASILTSGKKNSQAMPVIEFWNAHEYIQRNWLLSEVAVRGKDVLELLSKYPNAKVRDKKQIDQMIEFISVNPEHGIIQAALSFFMISQALGDDNNTIKLSSNVSKIFLYKYGYDFRGMLNLDEYWINDLANLKKTMRDCLQVKNLSSFLEYYVWAVSIQSEKALKVMREKKLSGTKSDEYNLTPRQKLILSLFTIPGAKITNRDIQKEFKVSQITSSRDLAKLATLGLIFTNGRGRSVFYTKV